MFAGYRLMSGALECRAQHESVACDSIFAWSMNETFFDNDWVVGCERRCLRTHW